jgi:hypothetical protein
VSTTEQLTDPQVAAEMERLGVKELLHFTTNIGLVGILDDGEVLSRARLPASKHLANVYPPNAKVRYDKDWLDHVNLSISRINLRYYDASERWHAHEDLWWCVLSFAPEIAAHRGVSFATTNNRYSNCRQTAGLQGLRALWADSILQYTDRQGREHRADRTDSHARCWPTCRQAEVLYPDGVSTRWLRRVYVVNELHEDIASVATELLDTPKVPIEVRPDVFR